MPGAIHKLRAWLDDGLGIITTRDPRHFGAEETLGRAQKDRSERVDVQ